jgi:hypothetical protein
MFIWNSSILKLIISVCRGQCENISVDRGVYYTPSPSIPQYHMKRGTRKEKIHVFISENEGRWREI